MTGCPSMVLLDTNVWLDDFIPSRARHDVVRKMIGFAATSRSCLP